MSFTLANNVTYVGLILAQFEDRNIPFLIYGSNLFLKCYQKVNPDQNVLIEYNHFLPPMWTRTDVRH